MHTSLLHANRKKKEQTTYFWVFPSPGHGNRRGNKNTVSCVQTYKCAHNTAFPWSFLNYKKYKCFWENWRNCEMCIKFLLLLLFFFSKWNFSTEFFNMSPGGSEVSYTSCLKQMQNICHAANTLLLFPLPIKKLIENVGLWEPKRYAKRKAI